MIKQKLQRILLDASKKIGVDVRDVEISYPLHEGHGDLSTNIALRYANSAKKNPMEFANEILKLILKESMNFVEKVEIEKPGFINFFLTEESLLKELDEVNTKKEKYASSDGNKGKKIVVEYSSPNIAKPFTIGHLRSTIIGDAIANLLETTGATVYRDNHVGDWGTQFGKLIYAVKNWGDIRKIEKSDQPLKLLVDLYVRFHQEADENPALEEKARDEFKELESGFNKREQSSKEQKELWEKSVDLSWKEFEKIYQLLGVVFTENKGRGYSESYFEKDLPSIIEELKKKKLLKKSKGAELVFFPKDKYPPLMIIKQDGTSLYSTRDLATDKFRKAHYGDDVIIVNEVGAEQSLYFRQLFETESLLGWFKEGQRVHVGHGLYRFKDSKISTRKGNTIWLEEVIDEARKKAEKLTEASGKLKEKSNIDTIALGSIKWNDLKRSPQLDVVFDWDEVLNMEGNSGPYMLYTYVRTRSILEQVEKTKKEGGKIALNPEELSILRKLNKYPDIVSQAAKAYSPTVLVTYLYDLAKAFNLFYQRHHVLKSEGSQLDLRVKITTAVGIVLKNGLKLLGIQTVEKM